MFGLSDSDVGGRAIVYALNDRAFGNCPTPAFGVGYLFLLRRGIREGGRKRSTHAAEVNKNAAEVKNTGEARSWKPTRAKRKGTKREPKGNQPRPK